MTDETNVTDGAVTGSKATEQTQEATETQEAQQQQTEEAQNTADTDSNTSDDAAIEYTAFDLPEGMQLDEALLGKATPLMQELRLDQESAQKAVNFIAELRQADATAAWDTHQQQVTDWEAQSREHKEFGGDKFDENLGTAKKAMDTFGSPELATLLEETGFGNHPEVIGFFYRAGLTLTEDNPDGVTGASHKKLSRAERMYPNDRHN